MDEKQGCPCCGTPLTTCPFCGIIYEPDSRKKTCGSKPCRTANRFWQQKRNREKRRSDIEADPKLLKEWKAKHNAYQRKWVKTRTPEQIEKRKQYLAEYYGIHKNDQG